MPVLLDDGGAVDNPIQMITREEWGAAARRSGSPFHGFRADYEGLVGHHTAGSFPEMEAAERAVLRGVQDFHQNGRGWTDIAYNFAVAASGRFYEGRGFQYRNGANSGSLEGKSANRASLSVVYLGNTERHPFTVEAANTIAKLKEYLELPVSACPGGCGLWGHRDVSPTTCPGSKMYAWINEGALKPC